MDLDPVTKSDRQRSIVTVSKVTQEMPVTSVIVLLKYIVKVFTCLVLVLVYKTLTVEKTTKIYTLIKSLELLFLVLQTLEDRFAV